MGVLAAIAIGAVLVMSRAEQVQDQDANTNKTIHQATCSSAARGSSADPDSNDAVLGPLVLMGARNTPHQPRDAFSGMGWKMSVSLPLGSTAILSVPEAARSRIGLIYKTEQADDSAPSRQSSIRFTACPKDERPGRTGWPGGLVTSGRYCATLLIERGDGIPVRYQVPLGRSC